MAEEREGSNDEERDERSGESAAAEGQESGEPTAEELEGQTGDPQGGDDSPGAFDEGAGRVAEEAEPLLDGKTVSSPVGPLPTRSLTAIAAFLVVFVIAFFALWGLLGGIGILLGTVVGAALGLGAMKLVADRSSA